ncbi:MAG TPA: peptidylprolyl isomerase [Polyangiaceae bacterium]|nr:peptidylprolyl isomerase [Polyangiaceae bacterium]
MDAQQLADRVYAEATAQPEAFTQLVARYSEFGGSDRGGDMGMWSTREPSDYPREVEVLAQLEIGQVAPPLDSPIGYEILRRTPERQRERYAAELLRMTFNPWVPDSDSASKASTLGRAQAIIEQARSSGSGWGGLGPDVCCRERDEWQDGRGIPTISAAVERLAVGDVAPAPVQVGDSYVVARRVTPGNVAPPSAVYELPAPTQPNVGLFLSQRGGEFTKEQFRIVDTAAAQSLALATREASALSRLHAELGNFDGVTLDARQASLDVMFEKTQALLGDTGYETYTGLLNRHVETLLLPSSNP